jgi:hypothetical protein
MVIVLLFTVGPSFDYRLSPSWLFKSKLPSQELRINGRLGRWLSEAIGDRLDAGKGLVSDEDWFEIVNSLNLNSVDGVPQNLTSDKSAWRVLKCEAGSATMPELLVLSWSSEDSMLFFTADGRQFSRDGAALEAAAIGKWVSGEGFLFANEAAIKKWKETHIYEFTRRYEYGAFVRNTHDGIVFTYEYTPLTIRCRISTSAGEVLETAEIVEGVGVVSVHREPNTWKNIWDCRSESANDQ